VHKNLKLIKFHSYKVKLIQKLNDDDSDLKFCDLMMETIDVDPNTHTHTFYLTSVLSNEAIFELNG